MITIIIKIKKSYLNKSNNFKMRWKTNSKMQTTCFDKKNHSTFLRLIYYDCVIIIKNQNIFLQCVSIHRHLKKNRLCKKTSNDINIYFKQTDSKFFLKKFFQTFSELELNLIKLSSSTFRHCFAISRSSHFNSIYTQWVKHIIEDSFWSAKWTLSK